MSLSLLAMLDVALRNSMTSLNNCVFLLQYVILDFGVKLWGRFVFHILY